MENMANDVKKIAQLNGELTAKASLAESYLEKIVEQAQEIGKLKERIAQLEQRLEKTAGDASTGDIASAG